MYYRLWSTYHLGPQVVPSVSDKVKAIRDDPQGQLHNEENVEGLHCSEQYISMKICCRMMSDLGVFWKIAM